MQTVSCVSRCWKTASFDSGFTSIKLCLRFTLMPLSEVNVWNQTFPNQFSINSPVSKTCIMWNYLPLTTSQSASAYFFTPNKTGKQKFKTKLGWKGCTWQSSVVLDVGLDSCLLERLLCYVHDLLGSTCSTSLTKTSALKICRFADNEDPKSRSLTSTFDRAVWECEKCVAPFEVLDCFCCLFHILYTGKILSWSDAINRYYL